MGTPRYTRAALRTLALVSLPLVIADQVSKRLVADALANGSYRHVIGDLVRFHLTFNTGAPMNIPTGSHGRWLLVPLSLVVLAVLVKLLVETPPERRGPRAASAVVVAGAVGNLIDRVFRPEGVVDFIDIGIGTHRFWLFNVADMCVTVGVVLLLVVMHRAGSTARPVEG